MLVISYVEVTNGRLFEVAHMLAAVHTWFALL